MTSICARARILVYPTLHYQNGGLEIGGDGFIKAISNLLVAGEAVGGIHGRNRLMGNSSLDIIVFGRNAGGLLPQRRKETELGTLTLKHIEDYAERAEERRHRIRGCFPRCCCRITLVTRDNFFRKGMDKSMREIEVSQITDIVEKLCIAANEHLPEDVKCAIRSCRACEDGQIAQGHSGQHHRKF